MSARRIWKAIQRVVVAALSVLVARRATSALLRGGITVDLHVGRRRRDLAPIRTAVAAPPEIVFDVIAQPYLGRTPRAMAAKLEVLERGRDFALAAHHTTVNARIAATTLELVTFERPHRIAFRLLRGPVAAASESFVMRPCDDGTEFEYSGFLEADFWALGTWWLTALAPRWERSVQSTVDSVCSEAERRAASLRKRDVSGA